MAKPVVHANVRGPHVVAQPLPRPAALQTPLLYPTDFHMLSSRANYLCLRHRTSSCRIWNPGRFTHSNAKDHNHHGGSRYMTFNLYFFPFHTLILLSFVSHTENHNPHPETRSRPTPRRPPPFFPNSEHTPQVTPLTRDGYRQHFRSRMSRSVGIANALCCPG